MASSSTCSPNPSLQLQAASSYLQCRGLSSSSSSNNASSTDPGIIDSTYFPGPNEHEQQQQEWQQQRQDAHRRGFGAKVALPSTDVLHEVLVGHAATIKLRAYHIGARIHIGQVLRRAQLQGCRTLSGKDYCIIWPPEKPAAAAAAAAASRRRQRSEDSTSELERMWSQFNNSSSSSEVHAHDARQLQHKYQFFNQMASALKDKVRFDRQHILQWMQQRQDAAVRRRGSPRGGAPEVVTLDAWKRRSSEAAQQVQPLLVVYRVGSVVLLGTQQQHEPAMIEAFVPLAVRYKAGGDSAWTRAYRAQQPRSPAEEHTVKVNPGQQQPAVKGTDQVMLAVLDVGGVRVITSVLAQSAALKFYETSVEQALDRLAAYRAMVRSFSKVQHSSWAARAVAALIPFSWLGEQERTFFKVVAASALVISEARALLEMAEPAWDYAAYHSIWAIAAEDCELEARLKALEVKLRQVEKEAKHDVKDRAGRRYYRLEQSAG
ncbi:hypothetical protein OEZ86_013487 [Tetradesmus obliquus]|nr:hypothetical protein OEZ86_013487 [Tetradesmus obliquus]